MSRIRVLLADDHETVRHGLRLLIDAQPDMTVVAEAGDGLEATRRAQQLSPDVVVLDVSMPEMNGLSATHALRTAAPSSAVVALTRYADDAYVSALTRAGARGYVLKQSPSSELLRAIRDAAAGRSYLDGTIEERRAQHTRDAPNPPVPHLTEREAEVLRLMARGYSNKEIANELGLSVKTVEVHRANGMRKLRLGGRIDLVKYAVLQGWLSDA